VVLVEKACKFFPERLLVEFLEKLYFLGVSHSVTFIIIWVTRFGIHMKPAILTYRSLIINI
jgi:hypothetical protein